jgi:tetratricopeptide (TPR) repeat protein
MSAWAQLSSLIKRPAVWLGGIIIAAAGTYVTSLLTPVGTFVSEKTAEISCRYHQKPIANGSQFTILVSPLGHDPDRSHTERVMRAFLGEKGFLVVPICKSLNFDFSADLQTATDAALQRASDLIKANHADLLLFGDVRERDKAVTIYAMNEHGGCDLRPKSTIIEHGDLPDDFSAKEKEELIAVSLEEIVSGCVNQLSIDWSLFAIRATKIEHFLETFPLSDDNYVQISRLYINAMRLLYSHDLVETWFTNGKNFAKKIIEELGSDNSSQIWIEYGRLLNEKFAKIHVKDDQDAAFTAFDLAINLNAKDAFAHVIRGHAYFEKGDYDSAIADYDKAISSDPKLAAAYNNRAAVYSKKG